MNLTSNFISNTERKFKIMHKLDIRIFRKKDVIVQLLNMFRYTKYNLPEEIWFYILNDFLDEGLSPHNYPSNFNIKAKYDYAYGKSLCGLPYGVWSIYGKCSYYYAPVYGQCMHLLDECKHIVMHIPVTNINITFNVDPNINPSMEERNQVVVPMLISIPFILYQSTYRYKMGQIIVNNYEKNPLHIRNKIIYNKIHHHGDYRHYRT